MIKLIASDLDGTLVPEGTPEINPELFTTIKRLKKKGIIFVAASGRQYISMKNLLEPVVNDIIFIADNGCCIIKDGEALDCRAFEKTLLQEILEYVRKIPNAFYMMSTMSSSYTECKQMDFIQKLRTGYRIKLETVEDLFEIEEPVLKVAVYLFDRDAAEDGAAAKEKFEKRANAIVSGEHWIDFIASGADKGNAVAYLQKHYHISPEDTMAFGDNLNDLGMFDFAEESYAVASARTEVKERAKHTLTGDLWDSVVNELKKLDK